MDPDMEPKTLLVDGYNVIKNTPALLAAERQSLAAARDALITQMRGKYRQTPHRVVVVFDGDGPYETTQPIAKMPRGQIVYSQRGEKADAVIARLCDRESAAGARVVICSNDLEVRASATTSSGHAIGVNEMARMLNAPPNDLRKRAQTRQHWRSQLERDGGSDDSPPSRKGNPRRAPKRKRR
ncbi:MAG: hypothetical protein OJF49_003527 [Ktedonobacterales bacterium]|jgi:predicted RNA-binding protein with PIN domain|nr:MAG: hypothetical protein OJF49_003527 [Ktedonobacterales bacterium]